MARRRPGKELGAPPWSLTYADVMSLLLVLFVYLYSLKVEVPEVHEPRGLRLAEGTGWTRLASLRCLPVQGVEGTWRVAEDEEEIEARVRSRLVGGRCRVALVGQAASREQAFCAAQTVRQLLERRDLGEERFVLLAQQAPARAGESGVSTVDVYATAGAVGLGGAPRGALAATSAAGGSQ